MTKSKAFKIFLLLFVAVFAIGICIAFTACGDSETNDDVDVDEDEDEDDDEDEDENEDGEATAILETSFFVGFGSTITWTFYSDYTVVSYVPNYATLNGTYKWAYTNDDKTEMTVYDYGDGDPDWTIELLSYNDEVIALCITSNSPAGLTGPYVAYPSGITAALQTQDEVYGYAGNVIVMYDDGKLNYYWSTSTFSSNYTISDSTLTFTVNGSETTGTLTFDDGGFIDGLTVGELLDATDVSFTPYGLTVEEDVKTVVGDVTSTTEMTAYGDYKDYPEIIFYDDYTLDFIFLGTSYEGYYDITGTTITLSAGTLISNAEGTVTLDDDGNITAISQLNCGNVGTYDFVTTEVPEPATVIAELTSTSAITFSAFGGEAYTCILTFYDNDAMDLTLTNVSTFPCTYTISNGTLTFSSDNGTYTNVTGTVTTTAVNDIITQISFTNFCNEGAATFTVGGAEIVGTLSATTTMSVYGMSATPELVFYSGTTMTFYFGSSMSYSGTYSITGSTIEFSAGMFQNISGTVTLDSDGTTIIEIANANFGDTYGSLSFNTTGTAAA